jgi:hypothetical protein
LREKPSTQDGLRPERKVTVLTRVERLTLNTPAIHSN